MGKRSVRATRVSPGLAAQNVLKYLLGFGEVFFLMSYNALTNEFQSRMTYPDPRKMPPGGGATD